MNEFLTQISPALLQFLGVVITAILTILGAKISTFLAVQKNAAVNKLGADKYNMILNIAKSVYYIVEEEYRTEVIRTRDEKISLFNQLLLQKVPGLTQDEIDHFRQSIVGAINDVAKKTTPVTLPAAKEETK